MELEAHLYDASGNEIVIPEGHLPIHGKFSSWTLPVDRYDAKFIYKPPLQSEIVGTCLEAKIALCRKITEDCWGEGSSKKTVFDDK